MSTSVATRCQVCANKAAYCTCPGGPRHKADTVTAAERDRQELHELRARIREIERRSPGEPYAKLVETAKGWNGHDYVPSLTDLVMAALGYDPSQDGLYLCRTGCGITWDHECDYGGWHGDPGKDAVSLTVQAEPSPRCATCKHWGADDWMFGLGTCSAIQQSDTSAPEAPALVSGEGWAEALRTRPTFGCVLHEPAPAPSPLTPPPVRKDER